ncbi:3-oxoacyl-[acyl-carrier-protein] reductase [Pseudonocardia oroxyli]|uniref:3-oxoacyl-[acyl-carrier-protein] reductase n=1 Tax=Pseudonocardia oroxyli TaxID=366584 RepID=A0A1G7HSS0_PSEOR|nr:3-oxoacyl-[acyl-carrier-protein] reductase [Pseudonocardia oroxyli]
MLVTGGNRGIGLAIAEAFAALGDQVAVTYRRDADLVPDGILPIQCDVTSTEDVDALFTTVEEKHGPVEVLVSNAGITEDGLIMRMSDDAWSSVLDANLTAAFRVARRASRNMLKARSGRMIFIASITAYTGLPGQVNYAASKSGLIGLSRSLAREFAPRGVTANLVLPGFVETEMTAKLPEARQKEIEGLIPLGRYGHAAEIAGAVTYLASDVAAYVTGSVLTVDGGASMGH